MSINQEDAAETEVCGVDAVSELEVVSLTGDDVPRYTLRADTENYGNDNTDWLISFPAVEDTDLPGSLHPNVIEAALSYFVLSGARVSQMTRTYSDIDAVTRLLREKERDLELAAKIGQQLLERNKQVEERVNQQEGELLTASETITQLRHELHLKSRLLQLYTNDTDEEASESADVSIRRQSSVELLQARVDQLQVENSGLRNDVNRISVDTERLEIREQELVKDVEWELSDANVTINSLSEELAARAEESIKHQEEITNLLAQLVDLQSRCTALDRENEELLGSQAAGRESQCQLTAELAELKHNYSLLQAMYRDAQQQIRRREKQSASLWAGCMARGVAAAPTDGSQPESLASELERSLHSLGSPDSGLWPTVGPALAPSTSTALYNQRQSVDHIKSVFDTVRYAHRASMSATSSTSTTTPYNSRHTHTASSSSLTAAPPPPDVILSASLYQRSANGPATPHHSAAANASGVRRGTSASAVGGCGGGVAAVRGVGLPASDNDAHDEVASVISESDYSVDLDECGSEHNLQQCMKWNEVRYSGASANDCYTPDSWSSLNTTDRSAPWRLSEKLQIVKPVSGSAALHHWSRLATPHLGSLLDHRSSGIITNRLECAAAPLGATGRIGARWDPLGAGGRRRRLNSAGVSDESDSETEGCVSVVGGVLGAVAGDTSGVYTLTNSTVLHPEQLLPPLIQSRSMCPPIATSTITSSTSSLPLNTYTPYTSCTSATPLPISEPPPPARLRPPLATSTFSTSRGLARALHERAAVSVVGQSPATSGDSDAVGSAGSGVRMVTAVSRAGSGAIPQCATPANSRCHSPELEHIEEEGGRSAEENTPQPQSIVQGLLSAGYGLPLGVGDLLRRALFSVSDCVPEHSPTTTTAASLHIPSTSAAATTSKQRRPALRLNRSVRRQMSLLERVERLGLQEAVTVIGQPPPLSSSSSPAASAATSSSPQQGGRAVSGVVSRRAAVAVLGHLPPALGTVPTASSHHQSAVDGVVPRAGRRSCVGSLSTLSVGRKGGFT